MRVVYFMADWCAPCKRFLPEVKAVCRELGVSLTTYDVNEDIDATSKYNVKSVPTLIIFAGDEIRFRAGSIISRQQLIDELQQNGGN